MKKHRHHRWNRTKTCVVVVLTAVFVIHSFRLFTALTYSSWSGIGGLEQDAPPPPMPTVKNNNLPKVIPANAQPSKQTMSVVLKTSQRDRADQSWPSASPSLSMLCEECREIVRKAPVVDLTYVDARAMRVKETTNDHKYDPTRLRRSNSPRIAMYPCNTSSTTSTTKDYTYLATQRIRVATQSSNERTEHGQDPPIRLLCTVYSAGPYHDRLQWIRQTWGPKCDGFFVASNQSDPSVDAVYVGHHGPEAYDNMWQKVRSIWAYIYDNYYQDYDWFHLGGDDMYVIVENLRRYLQSPEIRTASNATGEANSSRRGTRLQKPLFLGLRFKYRRFVYNTGGPGYTLNMAALKLLVTKGLPKYHKDAVAPFEDVLVADILHQLGVDPYPTDDNLGYKRYHHFTPGQHYSSQFPVRMGRLVKHYRHRNNQSSPESIAFHNVKGTDMLRLHALLYGLCV